MSTRIPFLARALRNAKGPLFAFARDMAEGPNHTFFVETKEGWAGIEIDRILTRKGIKVWGEMIVKGDIMFTVRRDQARWAQYLLMQAGVPIKEGSHFCAMGPVAGKAPPRASLPKRLAWVFQDMIKAWIPWA